MFTKEDYRLPAEWEPQSGVQLTWPHEGTDWAPMLDEITETYREMARVIGQYEPVLIVEPPTNDTWARDHGFITLVPKRLQSSDDYRLQTIDYRLQTVDYRLQTIDCRLQTLDDCRLQTVDYRLQNSEPILLDFRFNGWGEKFPAELDNAINRRLYDEGRVRGQYVSQLDFVLEGGSIESDGQGTVFTTTGCLMAPHRNQPMTREQIDERLRSVLCAERIVWIDHGQLTGDDTDGHIDTLVRICPDDTLLYVGCDDPNDEQYHELQLMEEQLRTLRTLDGRPYRLLGLPLPRPIHDEDGMRLPATYANFLVVNGAVLCPTYGQPDLDAEALRLIGQAFPDRDIIGIDSRPIIRQHGSLHCCTMQYPKGVIPHNAQIAH